MAVQRRRRDDDQRWDRGGPERPSGSEDGGESPSRETEGPKGGGPRPEPLPDLDVLQGAKDQLMVLTGRYADSVSGIRRSGNGWNLKIEMLELERIPVSTSVMATYLVQLDHQGNVVGYELEGRYLRGQTEER